MNKQRIIDVMRTQRRVWRGTANSEDILNDTARAIGYRIYKLTGKDLNKFAADCATPERADQ